METQKEISTTNKKENVCSDCLYCRDEFDFTFWCKSVNRELRAEEGTLEEPACRNFINYNDALNVIHNHMDELEGDDTYEN